MCPLCVGALLLALPRAPQGQPAPAEPLQEPRPALSALFEGALLDADNGQDFAETPGYRRLLGLVSRYRPEEIQSQAVKELDFPVSLGDPERWRGELVHVRGILAGIETIRLQEALPGRQDIYRATITEADFSEGVIVDLLERPEGFAQRDVVDVDGVFYRTVRYQSRTDVVRAAPYLIAQALRPLDPASARRSTVWDRFGLLIVALAIAFILFRVLFSVQRRRSRRASKARGGASNEVFARERTRTAARKKSSNTPGA